MKKLESKYPIAVNPEKVGTYPKWVKSGGGYFYDEVLEYRVWCHGIEANDGFKAFVSYEEAEEFYSRFKNDRLSHVESPLVLVLQKEYIDEPKEGVFIHKKEERIAEWLPEWLKTQKRDNDTIPNFLKNKNSNRD